MEIDSSAPATAHSEVEIDASPEQVWDVLADIGSWPTWNTGVKWTALEGQLAAGTTFRWKAGPGTITSTLRHVEQPHVLGWTGKTLGIEAVHVYRLAPRGTSTHVTSEESWDGPVVRLLRRRMARTLQRALDTGLQSLKGEVER